MTLLTLLDMSFPHPQLVSLGTMCDLENSQSVHIIIIQYEKFNISKQKLRIMNVLVMDCGQDPDANTVWNVD